MTASKTVLLIAKRELHERIRSRAFIIGTLITLVIIVAAIVVPGLLRGDGPDERELGVVGAVPDGFVAALEPAASAQDLRVELVDLADWEEAAALVGDGELDAALIDGRELMVDGPAPPALRGAVDTALQQLTTSNELQAAGLTEQQMAQILGAFEPVTVIDPVGVVDEDPLGWLVAMAVSVLLFFAIQSSGSSLLNGAIEEKSSRVVEVLLGTVRPWHLLSGKIAALSVLTFAQLGLMVGSGLGANAIVGAFELPDTTSAVVAWSLVLTIIGFVFYAALFTVAGSLASSAEDAQSSAGPLIFAVMAAYMLVFIVVIPSPGSLFSQILTFIPATAPFTVPARIALDAIAGWEILLAVLGTIIGAAVTVRLAGRLYASSVLAGGTLTWREAWQAEPVR